MKRIAIYALICLPFTAGCASTEPLEERIRELSWRLDAAEKSSEQATVDKQLAKREVSLSAKTNRVLKERLALAYDALREARTKLDEGLQDRLTELSESNPDHKLSISKYGGIMLESGVFFRAGRHELTPAGMSALNPLVATLLQEKYDTYTLEVAGHTDSDKIRHSKRRYRDNWDLGSMRANSVRLYLTKQGVPKDRIALSSFGYTKPIDASDKAKNRRVEIRLHKQGGSSVPASAKKTK